MGQFGLVLVLIFLIICRGTNPFFKTKIKKKWLWNTVCWEIVGFWLRKKRFISFLSPGRSSSFIKPLTQEKSLLISPWDRISIPTDLALFGRRIRLEWLDTGESEAGSGEGRRRDRTWQRRREEESQKRRAVDLFLLPFGSETGVDLLAGSPTNYRRVECQCMAVCTLMKRSSADSSVRTSSWRAEPFINFERKKNMFEKKKVWVVSLFGSEMTAAPETMTTMVLTGEMIHVSTVFSSWDCRNIVWTSELSCLSTNQLGYPENLELSCLRGLELPLGILTSFV